LELQASLLQQIPSLLLRFLFQKIRPAAIGQGSAMRDGAPLNLHSGAPAPVEEAAHALQDLATPLPVRISN
jgi:hypothetical protein